MFQGINPINYQKEKKESISYDTIIYQEFQIFQIKYNPESHCSRVGCILFIYYCGQTSVFIFFRFKLIFLYFFSLFNVLILKIFFK